MTRISRQFLEPAAEASKLTGHWMLDTKVPDQWDDLSGNGNTLFAYGRPEPVTLEDGNCAIKLDGDWQWLETDGPVVDTCKSFSIAAWVSLSELELSPGAGAYTALSQRGGTHTPFYLGIRSNLELQSNGQMEPQIRWCFLIAADDGSGNGYLRWQKAWSSKKHDKSKLNEWVLLIGTVDTETGTFKILIPGDDDQGVAFATPDWEFWPARQSLQVGRCQYRSQNVDYWPGSVAQVFAWEGIVTADEALELYQKGPFNGK